MQNIAGKHDIGLEFTYQGTKLRIIQFRSRATKNPFVAIDVQSGQKSLLSMTDYILQQIRSGEVTEIR